MIDPIVTQQQFAQVGDIRTGDTATTKDGETYPVKLDTFRITSHNKKVLEQLADLYGGTVTKWNDAHQLVTNTNTLPVVIPPQQFDPWLEAWTAGGLQHRCTGITEYTTNWPPKEAGPCSGESDHGRDCKHGCKPTTRFNVMLADTDIVGTFTVRSTGWNTYRQTTAALGIVGVNQGNWGTGTLHLRQEKRTTSGQTTVYNVIVLTPHLEGQTIGEVIQQLHPSGRPVLPADTPTPPPARLTSPEPHPAAPPPEPIRETASGEGTAPAPKPLESAGGTDANHRGELATADGPLAKSTPPASATLTGLMHLERLRKHLTNTPPAEATNSQWTDWITTSNELAETLNIPNITTPTTGNKQDLTDRARTQWTRLGNYLNEQENNE